MGNIRADTNNMRSNFEAAASHLIEVDPYRCASNPGNNPKGKQTHVSAVTFAGRGKTGVDLRWHTRKEFGALTSEQKDELTAWQNTKEGKKVVKEQRGADNNSNKRVAPGTASDSWKKKLRKAIKTQKGLSHVMTVLAEEESANFALVSNVQAQLTPAPATVPPPPPAPPATNTAAVSALATAFPALATKVKLTGLLKNK
jgi:hypothetical protein